MTRMPHRPHRHTAPALLVAVLLVAGLVAGCGDEEPTGAVDDETPSVTPSETAEPDPEPVSESPDPTASSSAVPPATMKPVGLRARLLGAGELPGLNDEFRWKLASTGNEGEKPFGACQRTSLTTIGADQVVVRRFVPADGTKTSDAAQLVAAFADPKSAWRAHQVLKSWRAKCAAWLSFGDERVSRLQVVKVPRGVAQHYLVQYGPTKANADDAYFDGFGIVRRGRYLSLVDISTQSQDYNYDPGQEPAAKAVRKLAAKF